MPDTAIVHSVSISPEQPPAREDGRRLICPPTPIYRAGCLCGWQGKELRPADIARVEALRHQREASDG